MISTKNFDFRQSERKISTNDSIAFVCVRERGGERDKERKTDRQIYVGTVRERQGGTEAVCVGLIV